MNPRPTPDILRIATNTRSTRILDLEPTTFQLRLKNLGIDHRRFHR